VQTFGSVDRHLVLQSHHLIAVVDDLNLTRALSRLHGRWQVFPDAVDMGILALLVTLEHGSETYGWLILIITLCINSFRLGSLELIMPDWLNNRQLLNIKIGHLYLLIADPVLMAQIDQIWSFI
jgi:hypothetical protein